ncbi:MAG: ATP-binding cassette domain-containing protein, partial [bacterium]|nr:ATP-binding cassette domain-containing protein [bacterium]
MLIIKNVSKSFGNKKVLDNVSLSVDKGKVAVLVGPSGVGKSTLLRVLNNLETIDSGTIELDNKSLDLHSINTTHIIGMIFQQFNLFDHLTVEQNIMLALEKTAGKKTEDARQIALDLLKR